MIKLNTDTGQDHAYFNFLGQAWFNGRRLTVEETAAYHNVKRWKITDTGLLHTVRGKLWDIHAWFLITHGESEYDVYQLETEIEILTARGKYEKHNSQDRTSS